MISLLAVCGCAPVESEPAKKTPTIPSTQTSAADDIPATTPTRAATPVPSDVIACDLALPAGEDWPVAVCETFEENQNGWQVESQENDYARYTSYIEDGSYIVDYSAIVFGAYQNTAVTWFDITNAKDFSITVEGLMDTLFEKTGWGIAFRGDEGSFFLFEIQNNATYSLSIYENTIWQPLIAPTPYSGILIDQVNTIGVTALDGDFDLFINGEQVNRFEGGLLEGTQILLVVSAREGANTQYFFDNIVLQTAP